jgi:hypothetical protein
VKFKVKAPLIRTGTTKVPASGSIATDTSLALGFGFDFRREQRVQTWICCLGPTGRYQAFQYAPTRRTTGLLR